MNQESTASALVVGHATHDRQGSKIVPGGTVLYAAGTWRALGARTGLATSVGEDYAFDHAIAGLEVSRIPSRRTTLFTNSYDEDGSRGQWVESLAEPVIPRGLPRDWSNPDILFLAPVINELDPLEWLDAVSARITGLNLQGFMRQPDPRDDAGGERRAVVSLRFMPDPGLLGRVTCAFLSEEDVTKHAEPGLLDLLTGSLPIVALTRGHNGARVFAEGKTIEVGIREAKPVDLTGAGDVFAAAFLLELARGGSPVQAARLGAAAASMAIEGRGPESLPRIVDAPRYAPLIPIDE